ncbi:uncharacterized protein [Spinacia oleracea]|uniref:Replication factor A C-terminal domain-containing protein n=1 Tax=Spinacia oleracea TaxID=3562 RepID=A0ABM3R852_SPIOL|nr:uncharacterized protein LOC110795422 [Spinacia oleracea]
MVIIPNECYCVVFATIVGFETDTKWYYNSCKQCNKKVDYEGGGKYWCIKCDKHVKSAPPRYKLTITVEDDSGNATFVMFDREVVQVQISAENLREKIAKDGKNSSFPDELDVLLDRNFLFRFHISNYNIDKNWDHFTVLRISDGEELIKSFLEVNNDMEERDIEVQSTVTSSIPLHEKEKESTSIICDNEDTNEGFVTPMKRPLEDVSTTGIEKKSDSAQHSSNKRKTFIKIEKDDKANKD